MDNSDSQPMKCCANGKYDDDVQRQVHSKELSRKRSRQEIKLDANTTLTNPQCDLGPVSPLASSFSLVNEAVGLNYLEDQSQL